MKIWCLYHKLNNGSVMPPRYDDIFEEVQQTQGLPSSTFTEAVKRLNTVWWSSRELCLKTLLERQDSVVLSLKMIKASGAFEVQLRGKADGLLTSIQAGQLIPTDFLFREKFAVTGPLSRYLQNCWHRLYLWYTVSLLLCRNARHAWWHIPANGKRWVWRHKMENDARSSPASTVWSWRGSHQRTLNLPGYVTHFISFWAKCCGQW